MTTWTTVLTVSFPAEAYVAKAKLEAEGLATFIRDEMTIQTVGIYSEALGGAKLQVPEEQAGRAIRILRENGFLEKPDGPVVLHMVETREKPPKNQRHICPYCGSEEIEKVKYDNGMLNMLMTILGFIMKTPERTRFCNNCKRRWRYK